jgi:hypothetical protein
MYEIEKKAFIDASNYVVIGKKLLSLGAKDLGLNDSESHFF